MNCKLNNVSVCLNATNFLGQIQQHWDIVLLGDMFYDEDFARQIEKWVQQLYEHGKRIFIGDPGRVGFDKKLLNRVQNVLTVDLPTVSQWENNGLTQGFVWEYYISMTWSLFVQVVLISDLDANECVVENIPKYEYS